MKGEKIHDNQSVIPDKAYVKVNGSLNPDTIKKLKMTGKQVLPKKKVLKKQGTFNDYL